MKRLRERVFSNPVWSTLTPGNTSVVHGLSVSWHPDGSYFAVGYDNGWIGIWDCGYEEPHATYPIYDTKNPCTPIYKLTWYVETQNGDRSVILAAGGGSDSALNVIEVSGRKPGRTHPPFIVIEENGCFGPLADFIVCYYSPWLAQDPLFLLTITDSGSIFAYNLCNIPPVPFALPLSLSLSSLGKIDHILQETISPKIMNDVMDQSRACSLIQFPLPIKYCQPELSRDTEKMGSSPFRIPENSLLLTTCHLGMHVLDLTSTPPSNLPSLSVQFESIQSIVRESLPDTVSHDGTKQNGWFDGMTLAWTQVDWSLPRILLGFRNGVIVELLSRKSVTTEMVPELGKLQVIEINAAYSVKSRKSFISGRTAHPKNVRKSSKQVKSFQGIPEAHEYPSDREIDDQATELSIQEIKADVVDQSQFEKVAENRTYPKQSSSLPGSQGTSSRDIASSKLSSDPDPDSINSTTDERPDCPSYRSHSEGALPNGEESHEMESPVALLTRSEEDLFAWRGVTMTERQLKAFDGLVFLPHRIMIPPEIKHSTHGAISDAMLAIVNSKYAVDIYDLDTECHVTKVNLKPICEQIESSGNSNLKKGVNKLLDQSNDINDRNGVTSMRFTRDEDNQLLLLVGCDGHIFVWSFEEECAGLVVCLRGKSESPIESMLIPDLNGESSNRTFRLNSKKKGEANKTLDNEASIPRECEVDRTLISLTKNAIRLYDLRTWKKLHSYKPDSKRHGNVVCSQLINPYVNQNSKLFKSEIYSDGTTSVLAVTMERRTAILAYPTLSVIDEFPHSLPFENPLHVVITTDGRVICIHGENRIMVSSLINDTTFIVQRPLTIERPRGSSSDSDHNSSQRNQMSTFCPLVDLPPRPQPPTTAMQTIFSILPFSSTKVDSTLNNDEVLSNAFGEVKKDAQGAQQIVNKAMEAMRERGERLERMEEKFTELSDNANQFQQMAKKIREDQEKRKWYQF
jgi:WD40 repeat protein